MLLHHLFENNDYGFIPYFLGNNGKVCVSLFLFLSAYGLSLQFEKESASAFSMQTIFTFYFKRFFKLYMNFWSVFICFVPIGIYVFNRTLADAYGSENIISSLILDFFGLGLLRSYNITWWFYQLIILLYLAFPALYYFISKVPFYISALVFISLVFVKVPMDNYFFVASLYYRAFILGIVIAFYRNSILTFLNKVHYILVFLISASAISFLSVLRFRTDSISALNIDLVSTLPIILLTILVFRNTKYVNNVLSFLGKHSMNIFMVHTFIFLYF